MGDPEADADNAVLSKEQEDQVRVVESVDVQVCWGSDRTPTPS